MLQTKLYRPKTKPNFVSRYGLYKLLDTSIHKKLCLVSAPAGYGKTTLLSQWIEKSDHVVSWYSLDRSDNEPTEFIRYIVAAVQSHYKNFGEEVLRLLNSANNANNVTVVSLLINDLLEIEDDIFIVFDDFHLITQKEVFETINFLLDHLPENVHIIILTRSDPPIPASRLRSQDQLLEIRLADLSFTANEIDVFFNKKLKLGIKKSEVYSLESKTEGWIAGLQLAALSIQSVGDSSAFIEAFAGSNRYIMDYLIEEVLRNQSPEYQSFLLRTSILKQISAPLCDAILEKDNSQIVLELLDKSNMFVIPLDTDRHWYRYHHLFADLLKQRLQLEEDSSIIEDLHKRAGIWLEKNGMYDAAIEHALTIKDYERSIEIIGQVIESMWKENKHSAILAFGESLPDELIIQHPEFCLYYAWILHQTGAVNEGLPYLKSAETFVKADGMNKALLGKIHVAFAYLLSNEQSSDIVIEHCKSAIEYLPANDDLWLGWVWYIMGNEEMAQGHLAEGYFAYDTALKHSRKTSNLHILSNITSSLASHKMALGKYKEGFKLCTDLLEFTKEKGYFESTKSSWEFAGLYAIMAVMQCIRADFDEALENVKIAYELSKNEKNIIPRIMTLLAYTYILYPLGDRDGSLKMLGEFEEAIQQFPMSPFIINNYVGWKIYLLTDLGELEQADAVAADNSIRTNNEISYENDFSYIQYVRLLVMQNKFREAESILDRVNELATSNQGIEILVQVYIAYAFLNESTGKHKEAVMAMITAMEYASEELLLNYFLFDLKTTKGVIDEALQIIATSKTKVCEAFVGKLKGALENKEKRRKAKAKPILSERELETLALLGNDISNQEIADKLFISLNTVKTRLKNIFLKLEVDNRRKAYEKGKEKGLI